MNIVQIGCHDGNDHVLDFIRLHAHEINQIIFIDANKNVIPYCQKTYEFLQNTSIKTHFLNYAVVKDSVTAPSLKLYVPKNQPCSLHCSYSYAHMKEHFHKDQDLELVDVPTITLTQLITQYNLTKIDYLYIDTEGMDTDIVNTIPFNQVSVDFIKFEHAHTDGPFSNGGDKYDWTVKMLERLGYTINKELNDTIATK
jgi:FkbM family methyltransferase